MASNALFSTQSLPDLKATEANFSVSFWTENISLELPDVIESPFWGKDKN